jgi:hypothetical protein
VENTELQEAWDLIANYLNKKAKKDGDIAHTFFINSVNEYGYLTISDAYQETLFISSEKVDDME